MGRQPEKAVFFFVVFARNVITNLSLADFADNADDCVYLWKIFVGIGV
jgi:hypothetical protein